VAEEEEVLVEAEQAAEAAQVILDLFQQLVVVAALTGMEVRAQLVDQAAVVLDQDRQVVREILQQ
jgi:hypothetical protein